MFFLSNVKPQQSKLLMHRRDTLSTSRYAGCLSGYKGFTIISRQVGQCHINSCLFFPRLDSTATPLCKGAYTSPATLTTPPSFLHHLLLSAVVWKGILTSPFCRLSQHRRKPVKQLQTLLLETFEDDPIRKDFLKATPNSYQLAPMSVEKSVDHGKPQIWEMFGPD